MVLLFITMMQVSKVLVAGDLRIRNWVEYLGGYSVDTVPDLGR